MIALAVGAASATAGAVDLGLPVETTLRLGVSPEQLPPSKPTHVRISLSGKYRTSDGSHVPALRELKLEGDRHLALDLKGVPVCRGAHLDYRGALEDACRDAVIGRGDVEVEVQIAEMLVEVTGKLTLYKGARKAGGRSIVGNLVVPAPVTAEVGIPVQVRRIEDGRFGWRATAAIPKIAAGAGSIAGYSVRIGKRFLTATCGGGRLELRVVSTFADGAELADRAVRRCAVPEADVRK